MRIDIAPARARANAAFGAVNEATNSTAQFTARGFLNRRRYLFGDCLNLGIGQGLLARLQGDFQSHRFHTLGQIAAFKHVKDAHRLYQFFIRPFGRAHHIASASVFADFKGEIARQTLQIG